MMRMREAALIGIAMAILSAVIAMALLSSVALAQSLAPQQSSSTDMGTTIVFLRPDGSTLARIDLKTGDLWLNPAVRGAAAETWKVWASAAPRAFDQARVESCAKLLLGSEVIR